MYTEIKLNKNDIFRVICDIIASRLKQKRGNIDDLPLLSEWTFSTNISKKDLAVDSLELMDLATGINQMFHLYETGVEEYLLRKTQIGDWTEIVMKSLHIKHDAITFKTSGSTGIEKDISHQWDELLQEVRFFSNLFQYAKRVVSFVPCHHIYGFLFTVILPKILNIPAIDFRYYSIGQIVSSLNQKDLIVSIPVQWRYFNESLGSGFTIEAADIQGITSTAPCPTDIVQSLRKKGIFPITEIFGSSETSGIGYRQSPHSPYRLLPFLNRKSDNVDSLEKQLPSGETRILDTVDNLQWVDHRRFKPTKRKDGSVQIGGTNVNPAYVAQKINDHPDIETCNVRMMLPDEGDRLKVFLVPKDKQISTARKSEIIQWIRTTLPSVERPAAIVFGTSLPRNEMGKVQDFQINKES
ncbi:MAG: 4-coumarate--CoA ligase [Candidatus Magnetoglobus multicellularis str. Araruama]|uniref:4-coumarate--CoA ligase n=1 Tax=Candidatus Magnetoglobus multicellularis str. Araruama TaxID=890399 RepID=A0A1V1P8B5_9BACT|nr:MAG: 4-coumarate--CoA ligase [Candidatus Magnetoglobus multicellularis str. Araruama]